MASFHWPGHGYVDDDDVGACSIERCSPTPLRPSSPMILNPTRRSSNRRYPSRTIVIVDEQYFIAPVGGTVHQAAASDRRRHAHAVCGAANHEVAAERFDASRPPVIPRPAVATARGGVPAAVDLRPSARALPPAPRSSNARTHLARRAVPYRVGQALLGNAIDTRRNVVKHAARSPSTSRRTAARGASSASSQRNPSRRAGLEAKLLGDRTAQPRKRPAQALHHTACDAR